jgi:hypothetical protein
VLRVLLAWPAKLRATSRQQLGSGVAESAEVTQLHLAAVGGKKNAEKKGTQEDISVVLCVKERALIRAADQLQH